MTSLLSVLTENIKDLHSYFIGCSRAARLGKAQDGCTISAYTALHSAQSCHDLALSHHVHVEHASQFDAVAPGFDHLAPQPDGEQPDDDELTDDTDAGTSAGNAASASAAAHNGSYD